MPNSENEAPSGVTSNNSYVSRPGNKGEPLGIVSDQERIKDPIDADKADSDAQLAQDDNAAIDQSNIIKDRTRGAKPEGSYKAPGDEEGLPANDGTSSV
ncbi:uncharacterized protein BCR38DRAFT_354143 [Pseudomassariella vexata]|uniref:Histone chaperone domain-containing protein n=1 Tax=Pseudomassariella vexata TaxID=1141098 RepID=A0A1Y2DF32_9PEZI|nr:uncharacterized protein BCR38DRAFT_354143 [Pseudomassariella vexata]ORY57797.1 hypothetical protein BCR38DRAFT_354143 [Pseudomassariella vexata]